MFWFNLTHNRTYPRPYGHVYIVAKFGTDWSIFADASVNNVKYGKFSNSRADNSDSSGPISSIIKLIRDLMVIYILTKFGADWLIFVDASVNKKIVDGWTDVGRTDGGTDGQRQTVSDHNSSLSTPCSGELIKEIRTHKLTLPKFWCSMHFSYEITQSTKGT